jgi:magnesium-protoporphyrin O-methyltransferase
MAGCCDPRGCERFFSARYARRAANRYRRRGLDITAREMVGFLESRTIADATVLEVGGGVGEIGIELLKRGARRAVNLELSLGYDHEGAALLADAGVQDRAARRRLDIALEPTSVEPADVVVLHRVVCCYPDYERLLDAAAGRARRLLVFSHPPRNAISRAIFTVQNAWFRISGSPFRTFAHPPPAMLETLERAGLRRVFLHRGRAWQAAGLERPDSISAVAPRSPSAGPEA